MPLYFPQSTPYAPGEVVLACDIAVDEDEDEVAFYLRVSVSRITAHSRASDKGWVMDLDLDIYDLRDWAALAVYPSSYAGELIEHYPDGDPYGNYTTHENILGRVSEALDPRSPGALREYLREVVKTHREVFADWLVQTYDSLQLWEEEPDLWEPFTLTVAHPF